MERATAYAGPPYDQDAYIYDSGMEGQRIHDGPSVHAIMSVASSRQFDFAADVSQPHVMARHADGSQMHHGEYFVQELTMPGVSMGAVHHVGMLPPLPQPPQLQRQASIPRHSDPQDSFQQPLPAVQRTRSLTPHRTPSRRGSSPSETAGSPEVSLSMPQPGKYTQTQAIEVAFRITNNRSMSVPEIRECLVSNGLYKSSIQDVNIKSCFARKWFFNRFNMTQDNDGHRFYHMKPEFLDRPLTPLPATSDFDEATSPVSVEPQQRTPQQRTPQHVTPRSFEARPRTSPQHAHTHAHAQNRLPAQPPAALYDTYAPQLAMPTAPLVDEYTASVQEAITHRGMLAYAGDLVESEDGHVDHAHNDSGIQEDEAPEGLDGGEGAEEDDEGDDESAQEGGHVIEGGEEESEEEDGAEEAHGGEEEGGHVIEGGEEASEDEGAEGDGAVGVDDALNGAHAGVMGASEAEDGQDGYDDDDARDQGLGDSLEAPSMTQYMQQLQRNGKRGSDVLEVVDGDPLRSSKLARVAVDDTYHDAFPPELWAVHAHVPASYQAPEWNA